MGNGFVRSLRERDQRQEKEMRHEQVKQDIHYRERDKQESQQRQWQEQNKKLACTLCTEGLHTPVFSLYVELYTEIVGAYCGCM